MKEFLQGTWVKHPLHPLLVHLPMALWPSALLFDVLAWYSDGSQALMRLSFYAIGLGLLASFLAIPTGLADWWDISNDKPANTLGLYHLSLNLLVTVSWLINFFLRWGVPGGALAQPIVLMTLSILGTLLLFVSGYLGGRMVYAYGTSVARHSKATWRRIAEAGKANVPPLS